MNEDKYLHEKELEGRVKELEVRVKKLWDEDLLYQHEEEEVVKKKTELIEKIKTFLQGTVDAGNYGGDWEESAMAEGAIDLCSDLLETIKEWENG